MNPAANVPPTASITAPANGATFTAPATVPITATAATATARSPCVEFFQGTTKIGEDLTAPYTVLLDRVRAGRLQPDGSTTDNAGGITSADVVDHREPGGQPAPDGESHGARERRDVHCAGDACRSPRRPATATAH